MDTWNHQIASGTAYFPAPFGAFYTGVSGGTDTATDRSVSGPIAARSIFCRIVSKIGGEPGTFIVSLSTCKGRGASPRRRRNPLGRLKLMLEGDPFRVSSPSASPTRPPAVAVTDSVLLATEPAVRHYGAPLAIDHVEQRMAGGASRKRARAPRGERYARPRRARINPANGSLTTVGTSPIEYFGFGSTNSGLYVMGIDANLYSIDPASGAATLIGPTGFALTPGSWYSLSTNSPTLYFADGANLYTLDTGTGAPALVGGMGGPQMGALLLEGGVVYGGENSPALAVATLNPTTGAATTGPAVTGTTGAFYALAPYPVPTARVTLNPSTMPSAGDPGVTNLTVTGTGFPIGTIPPANVTVTFNPTTLGGGPSGSATASSVTVVSGSTESVTFQIPTTIVVTTPTSYLVSIAGTNSTGTAFQSGNTAALTIDPALAITTSSPLPAGKVNVNYSQTIAATGGSGQYTWEVSLGTLPNGLSLNTASGLNYSQTIAATGGSGQYTWEVSLGTLPNGLSLNTASGLISGLPGTAGTSHFTIQVTDSNTRPKSRAASTVSCSLFPRTKHAAPDHLNQAPAVGLSSIRGAPNQIQLRRLLGADVHTARRDDK